MAKRVKKKKRILIVIFVCVVVGLFLFWRASHHKTPPLRTITVHFGHISNTVTAIGNIVPRHVISVKSSISGTVAKLFHHEGDFVKKRDTVVTN